MNWEFDATIVSIKPIHPTSKIEDIGEKAHAIKVQLLDARFVENNLTLIQVIDPLEAEFLKNRNIKLKVILDD